VHAEGMFDPIEPGEPKQPDAEEWQPLPPPGEAGPADLRHPQLGEPSQVWPYPNRAGLLEGYVCRFETVTPDGTPSKEFRPRRYGTLIRYGKPRTGWHWKGWGEGRPLFGVCELLVRPDAPVLIVEGERKVDAARRLFPDYIAVSPMNGAKSPHKTDWTPVAGHPAVVWPDHDEAGAGFARASARLATDAGAVSAAIVKVPQNWPEGWDLADALPDGVTRQTLAQLLTEAAPWAPPARSSSRQPKRPEDEAVDDDAEIERLAKLSPIECDRKLPGIAEKLGCRVPTLRAAVYARRSNGGAAPGQGRPLDLPDPEPCRTR
jgi:putative DNA primase/helicase